MSLYRNQTSTYRTLSDAPYRRQRETRRIIKIPSTEFSSPPKFMTSTSPARRNATASLARIDLGSLESDLNRFRTKLDQWADNLVAKTSREKSEHLNVLGSLADEIHALQQQHQALTQEAERVRQRLQAEAQGEAELQASLASLLEKQQGLPGLISDLQVRVNEEANRYYRKQAKADSKASIQGDVERGLRKIIGAYEGKLGLEMRPMEGGIVIGFGQVSRRHPEKVYSVELVIGEDGVYAVQKVPRGLEGTMQGLVDELNERNDLAWFLCGVRAALVENAL